MILKLMMKLFDFIGGLIMKFVQLPIFPDEMGAALQTVFEWMGAGMGIINFFCPLDAIAPAIAFLGLVYAGQKVYHLVMWVLQKIPMASIS